MMAGTTSQRTWTLTLESLTETEALAESLALISKTGDVIALSGELGTGKTAFARAFINAIARRSGTGPQEVPSPTFTLLQTYEFDDLVVSHFDFYRIEEAVEALEIGLEDALMDSVCLIEWPERIGDQIPGSRLDVEIRFAKSPESRTVRLVAGEDWIGRLSGVVDGE